MPNIVPDISTNMQVTEKVNVFDDWSLYVPTPGKVAGEMGTGNCGDATFTAALKTIASQPATMLRLPGDLKIFSTANPNHWTLKQFLAYGINPKAICAVGGTYPLYAYPERLLWVDSCGSGAVFSAAEEQKYQQCDTIQKQVQAYFNALPN